jgi:hypothetical protein
VLGHAGIGDTTGQRRFGHHVTPIACGRKPGQRSRSKDELFSALKA